MAHLWWIFNVKRWTADSDAVTVLKSTARTTAEAMDDGGAHNSDGIPCPTFIALGLLTDDSVMPCRYMLPGRFIPAAASSSAELEPAPLSTDAAAVLEVPVSRGTLRPQDKVRLNSIQIDRRPCHELHGRSTRTE